MWTVRLTDAQREALIELVRASADAEASLAAALEELEYARWDELPDAQLPWDRVAELARAQRIGEADVVWDLCGGLRTALRGSAFRRPRA
jgi:hypothetical protein